MTMDINKARKIENWRADTFWHSHGDSECDRRAQWNEAKGFIEGYEQGAASRDALIKELVEGAKQACVELRIWRCEQAEEMNTSPSWESNAEQILSKVIDKAEDSLKAKGGEER